MSQPTAPALWTELEAHRAATAHHHLRDVFAADPERASRMRAQACGITLDYAKNRVDERGLALLLQLAEASDLARQREAMFAGERINGTEERAVLHTALRAPAGSRVLVDGEDVISPVVAERERIRTFATALRSGQWRGYDDRPITDVVNIGIGGSDLGPQMVCAALADLAHPRLRMHFVSNVDGVQMDDVLRSAEPATTLFIVTSKTFSTQETLTNAHTARDWLVQHAGSAAAIAHQFVAVTTNLAAAGRFGILPENCFGFWDWVGGRYSLWSAVGLPIVLQIGADAFDELLAGAQAMDEHFCSAPLAGNLPVLLAMLGIWNIDFLDAPTQVIAPYHQRLHRLPAYLQQLDMESNGKSVRADGSPVHCQTGPVIWGEPGINAQHAYFQMLHQGTRFAPVDFIGVLEPPERLAHGHRIAFANMVAQAEALMRGRSATEIELEMRAAGLPESRLRALLPHRIFPGNRPSNTILLERLDPRCLGALLALYEHRTFVQGVVWGLNSFDQWGVELGKQLAVDILRELDPATTDAERRARVHDCSTAGLIDLYRRKNQ